jgi:uncharacterized OsmC-like protein
VTTTPTSTYLVEAQSQAGGVAHATSKQHTIGFDASAGQSETVPGPADLLAAAFAACVLKNVERFSHILPFAYQRAEIHVEADRQGAPPRIAAVRYRLHIVTDEPAQLVDLLHRNIARHGTIYNTLAAVCDVTGEITAEPIKSG